MERMNTYKIKIVPDSEPNADGEWIAVETSATAPRRWTDMVNFFRTNVPEGKHLVAVKNVIPSCCAIRLALVEPDEDPSPYELTLVTCPTCGRTWESKRADDWRFVKQERRCTKCGHWSCPCCGDSCDQLVGEDDEPCCESRCTYKQN